MKGIFICLLVLLCCLSVLEAQNGGIANNWYFGYNAGINFNTGSPTAMSGPIYTQEGSAVVSDVNGNLLFSTNGIFVYDKNNNQMQNGFGLLGHSSTTQSALIVPNPGSSSQYYIFTASGKAGYWGGYDGIACSKVNIVLNGGLGIVTVKNDSMVYPAAEKLTAVRHCNGTDYWVICHEWNSDAFYVYQVTSTGINSPIISHVGSVYQSVTGGDNSESIGYLKASPNGNRLAAMIDYIPNNNIELFDFDNSTGIISNPVYIPSVGGGYGVAFSPDNTKLYVSFEQTNGFVGGLLQYDLTAANIPASLYTIVNMGTHGALQLGPDGKLYVAKNGYIMGVVNYPNVGGVGCVYVSNGLTLSGGTCALGLPNFSENLVYVASTPFNIGNDTTVCNGDSLILDAGIGGSSYLWSNGANTQMVTINSSGMYWVQKTLPCGVVIDTIVVSGLTNASYLVDTFVCKFSTTTLNAASGYTNYQWNTGANTQSIVVSQAGQYYVSMIANNGCIVNDTLTVVYNPNTVPNATFTAISNNNVNGTFTTDFTYASTAGNLQSYWDFGDGGSDTSLLPPVHVYPCGEDFLVRHIIGNECGEDTFEVMVNAPCDVGVEDGYGLGFSVYPNPIIEGGFYVEIENREGNDIVFCLYDVMGKLVFSERLLGDRNRLVLPVGVGNGVYVGRVMDGNRVGSVRVSVLW